MTIKCVHHWLIDQEHHGVCKKCGAKRRFPMFHEVDKFRKKK